VPRLAFVFAVAVLVAACGGSGRPSGGGHVRISLASPGDGTVVRAAVVEVRGTVRPRGAAVEVAGRPAAVSGGAFDVVVPLETGANVLDVAATAPGARPAVAALRVRRDDRVAVPDLTGDDPDVAQARLEDLGLKVSRERGGGFFDPLIPEAPRVCSLSPRPGSKLDPGSRVTLVWARHC
jgi:PASTA domain-containing protein/glucodextranase-like protein